jgi:hypothetical protein
MEKEGKSSRSGPMVIGAVLIGLVVIACLLVVVTIAILALLGPQIGNVFSQINSGLQTTPIP